MTDSEALEVLLEGLAHHNIRVASNRDSDGHLKSRLEMTGPKGTCGMTLQVSYYKDAAQDPEHMTSYISRVVAKLKKEVGL